MTKTLVPTIPTDKDCIVHQVDTNRLLGMSILLNDFVFARPFNPVEDCNDGLFIFELEGKTYCRYFKFGQPNKNYIDIYGLPETGNMAQAEFEARFEQSEINILGKVFAVMTP